MITVLEHFVFRRKIGYNVDAWDVPGLLPSGIPAIIAWACALTMAFLGAHQTWLIGPISGDVGADIGWELVST